MLESLIIFALSVYWLFHVLTRSDLTARPRAWVLSWAPAWLAYISTCAFCFTSWVALGLVLIGAINWTLAALCAAPVVNMVLDLVVRTLIRANEPPVLEPTKPDVALGESMAITHGAPGVPMSIDHTLPLASGYRLAHVMMNPPPPPWVGPLPEGWTTHTTGTGPWATVFSCFALHGRRVRTTYCGGRTGVIEHGFRNGDDCSGTFGELMYRLRWEPGQTSDTHGDVPIKSCTFLDLPDTPFNPLDHEQTK